MRAIFIWVALLGGCTAQPSKHEIAAQTREDCRQARELSESVAGLRHVQNQRPTMPPELQSAAYETCRLADAMQAAN